MANPLPAEDPAPYTLRVFQGNRHLGDTECPTTASLGGHIAHAMYDPEAQSTDRFIVVDREERIIMRYSARGKA